MIDPTVKKNIIRMLNAFENDSASPNTEYDKVYIYADGNNGRRQVTLGRGYTEDGGNLKKVVSKYSARGGKYSSQLGAYLSKIGKGTLASDASFKKLLVAAGKEDQKFRDAQDEVFDEAYWNKAEKWFESNGFKENLSMAVVADSWLHSGGILGFLRNSFDENVPSNGGDEKKWIQSYITVRRAWLKRRGKPLSNTLYRMDFMLTQLKKKNWDFDCPLIANDSKVC